MLLDSASGCALCCHFVTGLGGDPTHVHIEVAPGRDHLV